MNYRDLNQGLIGSFSLSLKEKYVHAKQKVPAIRPHLLWEYDWDTIDFSRLATVVIERVIERGNPAEWQEIVNFYGLEQILSTAEKSTRLDLKHKNFTRIYLKSGFIYDPQRPGSYTAGNV